MSTNVTPHEWLIASAHELNFEQEVPSTTSKVATVQVNRSSNFLMIIIIIVRG
jgi:hypothetical protein